MPQDAQLPLWEQNRTALQNIDKPLWEQNRAILEHKSPLDFDEEDQDNVLEFQALLDTLEPPVQTAESTGINTRQTRTRVQETLDMAADAEKSAQERGFMGPPDIKPDPIDDANREWYTSLNGDSASLDPYAQRRWSHGPLPFEQMWPNTQQSIGQGKPPKDPSELTAEDVGKAQAMVIMVDMASKYGVEGARNRLKASGAIDPRFQVWVDGFLGTTPSGAAEVLTTDFEKNAFGLFGILAGFYAPSRIVGAAGVVSKTALKASRLGAGDTVASLAGRAIGSAATFGLRGTTEVAARIANDEEVTAEEAAKHITYMTLFGGGLGITGGIPMPVLRIPAEGMYGYLTAYLQGATPTEALTTGVLFMGLGMMNTRNVKYDVRNAGVKHVIEQGEKDLASIGVLKAAFPKLRAMLYDIWSRKVNPNLNDLIKYQDEVAAFVKEAKTGKPIKPEITAGTKSITAGKKGVETPSKPTGQVEVATPKPDVKTVPHETPGEIVKPVVAEPVAATKSPVEEPAKPAPEKPATPAITEFTQIVPEQVEVSQIKVRPELFQPRDKIDPDMVQRIATGFDPDIYDPPLLWRDPETNDLVMVSGHTRLEGLKEGNIGRAPFRILPAGTTVEQARVKSEEGNLQRVEQNDWENSRVIRRRIDAGDSKSQIQKDLPGLGSPAKVANLERLGHLDTKGFFNENWDNPGGFPKIKQFGYFTGGMRKTHPWLTERHERDIFEWLYHSGAVHHKDSGVPQEVIINVLDIIKAGGEIPARLVLGRPLKTGRDVRPDMAEGMERLKDLRKDTERLITALNIATTQDAKNTIKTELALIADKTFTLENELGQIEAKQTRMFEARERQSPTFNMFTGDPERIKSPADQERVLATQEIREQYERDQEFIAQQAADGKMTGTKAKAQRAKARNRYVRALEAQGQKNLFDASAGEDAPQGTLFSERTTSPKDRALYRAEPKELTPPKPMTIQAQRRRLQRNLGIPIRGKATHRPRNSAGWYQPRDQLIRVFDYGDLPTYFHEAGHHMERMIWGNVKGRKHFLPFKKELADLDYKQPPQTGGRRTHEGFAEYIRILISDVMDPAKAAPEFHAHFMGKILPENKDVRLAIEQAQADYKQYREQGSLARVKSQIDYGATLADKIDRFKEAPGEAFSKALMWFRKRFEGSLVPIEKAMEKAGIDRKDLRPSEDPIEVATAVTMASHGMARQMVVDRTFNMALEETGPGLEQVFEHIAHKDMDNFLAYAYARKAMDLINVPRRKAELGVKGPNKPIDAGISPNDAMQVIKQFDNPVWREASDGITAWSGRVLDYLVEAGGMSPDVRNALDSIHWVYLPLMRAIENAPKQGTGKGIANLGSPIKKLHGSGRPIINPIESMIQLTERIISTANKVRVGKALIKLQRKYPDMPSMLVKVPLPMKATQIKMDDILQRLVDLGAEFDLEDADVGDLMTFFTAGGKYTGNDKILSLWDEGESNLYEIVDDDLYQAMLGLDVTVLPPLLDLIFGVPTRMLRTGAVILSPSFSLVRNLFRDVLFFSVTSAHTNLGPFPALRGTFRMIGHDLGFAIREGLSKLKRSGVKQATFIGQDRHATKALETRIEKGKTVYYVTNPYETLRAILQVTEIGSRSAEFEAALEADLPADYTPEDVAIYATNAAKRVTVDFGRAGSWGRIINQMFPFWNANVQGPATIYNSFKTHPGRSLYKFMLWIGSLSTAIWLKNHDRDDYKELSSTDRALYWHAFFDDDENGRAQTIIKLSKPFELGMIATAFEAYLDERYSNDPDLFEDVMDVAKQQSIGPFLPQDILRNMGLTGPAVDIYSNEDFAGRPIVPRYAEDKLPKDQVGPYTIKLYKYLGAKWDVSPAKIEHFVNGYTGGLTGRVVRTIDNAIQLFEDGGENLTKSDIPVIGTLFKRGIGKPGRSIERFYTELDDLSRKDKSDALVPGEAARLELLRDKATAMSLQWAKLREAETKADVEEIYRNMVRILRPVYSKNEATDGQR